MSFIITEEEVNKLQQENARFKQEYGRLRLENARFKQELSALHSRLAGEALRADQMTERYEQANRGRIQVEKELADLRFNINLAERPTIWLTKTEARLLKGQFRDECQCVPYYSKPVTGLEQS